MSFLSLCALTNVSLQPDYDDFDDESRLKPNMRGRVDKARDSGKKYGNKLFNNFFLFSYLESFCFFKFEMSVAS